MTTAWRRAMSDRGAELIEFALVLPLLLFIVMGIVEFGFLFQRYEVITNAAREGARIAVLPGYFAADVQARVQDYLMNGGVPNYATATVTLTDVPVTVAGGPAITGKRVLVTYSEPLPFIGAFAGFFGGSFTTVPLNGIATMRPEVP